VDLREGAASALHDVPNTAAGFRPRPSSLRQAVDRLFGGRGWKGGGKKRGGNDRRNGSSVSSPETTSTSQISLPPAAVGCPQNRMVRRVDGSSPSEDSAKAPQSEPRKAPLLFQVRSLALEASRSARSLIPRSILRSITSEPGSNLWVLEFRQDAVDAVHVEAEQVLDPVVGVGAAARRWAHLRKPGPDRRGWRVDCDRASRDSVGLLE